MPYERYFSIIVAVDTTLGISKNGKIPWKIEEMRMHFEKLTTKTIDPAKMNCCIMGRNTWEQLPETSKPLLNRINVIVSTTLKQKDFGDNVFICESLEHALQLSFCDQRIENVFVIGGKHLFDEAMEHPYCEFVHGYMVDKDFECDIKIRDFSLASKTITGGFLCESSTSDGEKFSVAAVKVPRYSPAEKKKGILTIRFPIPETSLSKK